MGVKERLKKFVKLQEMPVREFEETIGVSNGYVNSISKSIGIDKLTLIVEKYPKLNLEWLFTGEGEPLKAEGGGDLQEPKTKYPPRFIAPKVVTVDKSGKDNIVLVPQKAAAGYLLGYGDPKFINSLPTYNLPNLQNGTFRMFQVSGHSMYPTLQDGSFVVGEWVENWAGSIKDDRVYIIISQEDGVTVKRVLNRIDKYGALYCKSDNRREYPSFTVKPKDLVEVWEVKMHLSFQLPNPAQLYDRVSDLEAELIHLKDQFKGK
jgi:phage repressor protein C with HTH and peptisase S24 domain